MHFHDIQQWIETFYDQREWSKYGPFERIGFLMEEVGETARAIRALEIGRDRPDETTRPIDQLKENVIEELGDVLANVIILAKMYDVSLADILRKHQRKLSERFNTFKNPHDTGPNAVSYE